MNKSEHHYYLLAISIIVIVFLIACGTSNSSSPMTPLPTKEVTFTPFKQIVNTPASTRTMEPTLAYWATAQEERFETERIQIAETKQAIFSLATNYPQMCGYQFEGVFVSPGGKWIASNCKFDSAGFRVFQTYGNLVWEIPYSKIFPHYPDFVGGARALHWSAAGNYLYFATWACCPDIDSIGNGDNLYRLNLETGALKLMVTGNFHFYSFSPDGQKLAYTPNNQTEADNSVSIHILDLNTKKEEVSFVGDFDQVGIGAWKQNGRQLLLIAQNGSLYAADREFALVFVDLYKKESQVIIDFTEDVLYVTSWSEDDILTISRSSAVAYYGYYVNFNDLVFYDLKINQFITSTSVP